MIIKKGNGVERGKGGKSFAGGKDFEIEKIQRNKKKQPQGRTTKEERRKSTAQNENKHKVWQKVSWGRGKNYNKLLSIEREKKKEGKGWKH